MEYLEFFDLKENPFRLTPDPYYFYPSESHNETLSSFNYIVEQKEGFFMCVGEPGTGKTTLLNTFLNTEKWHDRAGIALVLTPRLSPEEFLLTVLEDLNVKVKNTNKNEIIKAFRDFLIENSMIGRRIIIIVDEAQSLPDDTLEELRLLSNLETEKEKLLQIVLIGQPELRDRLFSDRLKQLNQRITVRATLRPLTIKETSDYINYRLVRAGKGTVIFEEKTKKLIHKLSKGSPRLINLVSSRAMMAAYLDMSRYVKKRHVAYAIKNLSDSFYSPSKNYSVFRRAALFLLSAVIIFSAILVYKDYALYRDFFIEHFLAKTYSKGDVEQLRHPEKKTTVIVIVDSAKIRMEPSVSAYIISWVSKGVVLETVEEITEANGRWYRVKTADGKEGWIEDKAVKLGNKGIRK